MLSDSASSHIQMRKDIFRKIAVDALTLNERATVIRLGQIKDCELSTTDILAVEEWKKLIGSEQLEEFEFRLDRLGITSTEIPCLFNCATLQNYEDFLAWQQDLEQVFQYENKLIWENLEKDYATKGIAHELPAFWQMLIPFVAWSLERFQVKIGENTNHITDKAQSQLVYSLFSRLSWAASKTFALKLNIARIMGDLRCDNPHARYEEFVSRKSSDLTELATIFLDYPALARILVSICKGWVDSNGDLVNRFVNDRSELVAHHMVQESAEVITEIETEISDTHSGQRTVAKIYLSSGEKLIYKPRDVSVELAYQDFFKWLSKKDKNLELREVRLLPRSSYAWSEFVPFQSCEALSQIRRFYFNQGVNLCLLYVLGATDLHFENLISDQQYPVLIDLECLFCPKLQNESAIETLSFATVLRTGLLPSFIFGDAGIAAFDSSGLGGEPVGVNPIKRATWENYKTDEMRLVVKYLKADGTSLHIPLYNGKYYKAWDYSEEVIQGFTSVYKVLLQYKSELLSNLTPLSQFNHTSIRIVARSTDSYYDLLDISLEPRYLKSGLLRSIVLDSLWRNSLGSVQEEIIESEINSLWFCDLPIFINSPTSYLIRAGQNEEFVGNMFELGYQTVLSLIGPKSEYGRKCATLES
jgi:type 2 lantibiotic biosynthesis protein LanM